MNKASTETDFLSARKILLEQEVISGEEAFETFFEMACQEELENLDIASLKEKAKEAAQRRVIKAAGKHVFHLVSLDSGWMTSQIGRNQFRRTFIFSLRLSRKALEFMTVYLESLIDCPLRVGLFVPKGEGLYEFTVHLDSLLEG